MSFFFPEVDKIYVYKRKGTQDDPYVSISESLKVVNSRVILKEVPDLFTKVTVKDSNGNFLYETTSLTPNANEYRVDYSLGIVYFNSSNEGKEFTFDYRGVGLVAFPASRIWTRESNGEITETLQGLIDTTTIARDSANTAATNANNAATNAKNAANNANTQATYAQQVANENKTRWLTAVNTYADIVATYPNPQLGDTVQTIDDSKIYRWDGTQWVWTQQYNANAITDVQNKIGILSTADDVLFQNDRSIFLELDKYKKLRFQQGTATITGVSSNGYFRDNEPFIQVTLTGYAQINAPNYAVVLDVISANGDYGQLIVYDKTQNGFKVKMTGSASSVTFIWTLLNPLVA
jgi:hypothetical protein